MATKIGVGESTRFLRHNRNVLARVLTTNSRDVV